MYGFVYFYDNGNKVDIMMTMIMMMMMMTTTAMTTTMIHSGTYVAIGP